MSQLIRVPLFLLDGPDRRASACRQVLDLVGIASAPLSGALPERAILLVDPSHPQAAQHLARGDRRLKVLRIADDLGRMVDQVEAAARRVEAADAELELMLAERVSDMARVGDLRGLIELTTAAAMELTGARAASVLLVEKDATHLEFLELLGGPREQPRRLPVPVEGSLAGWVVQHRQPMVSHGAPDDRRHFRGVDAITGDRTDNLAAVPLLQHGRVVGVLEVLNRADGFTPQHVAALTGLAPHLVAALVRLQAQPSAAPEHRALEPAQVEGAIRRAKLELEQTIDALPQPLALMSGFVVRRANQSYAKQVNAPIQSVSGSECYALWGRTTPCPGCPLLQTGTRALRAEVVFPDGVVRQVHRMPLPNGAAVVRYEESVETREALEAQQRRDTLATAGQLAAAFAHDFGAPLSQLRNLLKALRQQGAGARAEAAATLSQVDAEALRLAGFLHHVREMSEFVEVHAPEPVDVGAALTAALERGRASLPGVEVQATPVTAWVNSSARPLRWAIETLVRSTLQAASEDRHPVRFTVDLVGSQVVLGVATRGPRLDAQRTTEGGLSLTLACHILRGIGAQVEVGLAAAGTVVQISLPKCTPEEVAIGASQAWLKDLLEGAATQAA
jgi:GAF domain-containing protein